jgi:hypothetical protein
MNVQCPDYHLVVLDLLDVSPKSINCTRLVSGFCSRIGRLDGYHTGKASFDTFTHTRATIDNPGWYNFELDPIRLGADGVLQG